MTLSSHVSSLGNGYVLAFYIVQNFVMEFSKIMSSVCSAESRLVALEQLCEGFCKCCRNDRDICRGFDVEFDSSGVIE